MEFFNLNVIFWNLIEKYTFYQRLWQTKFVDFIEGKLYLLVHNENVKIVIKNRLWGIDTPSCGWSITNFSNQVRQLLRIDAADKYTICAIKSVKKDIYRAREVESHSPTW